MSIIAVTGDHPRHAYMVSQLAKTGLLSGWIRERRENFVPEPPNGLTPQLSKLFTEHFRKRSEAEDRHFGRPNLKLPAHDILDVSVEDLNGTRSLEFIRSRDAKFIISYGCHKLNSDMLSACKGYAWNVHGGLSPSYRGVATHFWPSYMLEPQMTGVTLHETTEAIDGGGLIHQTGVALVAGDGVHDLACRAVKLFADELPEVLILANGIERHIEGVRQKTTGRIWTNAMWRPEHLITVYQTFSDSIVDLCLSGEIKGRVPNLVQFGR